MKKNDTVYLQHILEAIKQIEVYTSNVSYEQFLKEIALSARLELDSCLSAITG